MHVAVVDIGTNSTRLLVAELDHGRVTAELERESQVTRLGAGVDSAGRLQDEAMERVYATLERYREAIDRHGAERAVAVLTSAVRDAANGAEFAETVEGRFGLEPHVLTGEEEARLTFLGATSERDPSDDAPTLVIDIGGGSTELVSAAGSRLSSTSPRRPASCVMSERHIHGDPPSADELEAAVNDVRGILEAGVPEEHRDGGPAGDRGGGDRDVAGGDRAAAGSV